MRNNKIFFLLGFLIAIFSVVFFTHSVFAVSNDYGLKATAQEAALPTSGDIPAIIGNVVGAGLSFISVLFFILMIYAGIIWMTARGDDARSKKALDTIFAAVIGIVIVLAAYAITNFVLKSIGTGGGGSTDPDDAQCKKNGAAFACVEDAVINTTCKADPLPGLCHGKYSAATTLCCEPIEGTGDDSSDKKCVPRFDFVQAMCNDLFTKVEHCELEGQFKQLCQVEAVVDDNSDAKEEGYTTEQCQSKIEAGEEVLEGCVCIGIKEKTQDMTKYKEICSGLGSSCDGDLDKNDFCKFE